MKKTLLLAVLAASLQLTSLQAVDMCWIFGNNMVLQADRPLPVWGQGKPGEEVLVEFAGQQKKATVGEDGEWKVTLDPMPMNATGEPFKVTAASGNKVFDNVLLGDVWLASGQSNMAQPPAVNAEGGAEEAKKPVNPLFRVFPVAYNEWAPEPNTKQFAWKGKVTNWFDWIPANPQVSGVPYYFGSMLQKETGRPIGVIISPVGASNAECWISMKDLEADPYFKDVVENSKNRIANAEVEREKFKAEVAAWEERKKAAQEAGQPFTEKQPHDQRDELAVRWWVGALYNARIAPLRDLAIKGVIWYQGENNAGSAHDGDQYLAKKAAMIADWRKWFNNPDLPFYFVQLAAWQQPNDDAGHVDSWAHFRNAQRLCLTIPHTGMASAVDVGDADDIHPKNKYDVGERLARWALAKEYGKEIETSGPLYRDLKIEQSVARVQFNHTGKGLMIGRKNGRQPVVEDSTYSLQRFAIAGADGKWHWADARIDGDTIVCSSDKVPQPVAVRYAFSTNPAGANLYTRDGLPASPFRSDDW